MRDSPVDSVRFLLVVGFCGSGSCVLSDLSGFCVPPARYLLICVAMTTPDRDGCSQSGIGRSVQKMARSQMAINKTQYVNAI